MSECTAKDLRSAREEAGLTIWQAAAALNVGETTLRRWEHGEVIPQSADVSRMERLYRAPGLWHRWMRSNDDAYREHYPARTAEMVLPAAVANIRFSMADMQKTQEMAERDALDGQMDDKQTLNRYRGQLQQLLSDITSLLEKLDERTDDHDPRD